MMALILIRLGMLLDVLRNPPNEEDENGRKQVRLTSLPNSLQPFQTHLVLSVGRDTNYVNPNPEPPEPETKTKTNYDKALKEYQDWLASPSKTWKSRPNPEPGKDTGMRTTDAGGNRKAKLPGPFEPART